MCRCGLFTWNRKSSSRNPTGVRSPRRRHRPPVAHDNVASRSGGRVKGGAAADRREGTLDAPEHVGTGPWRRADLTSRFRDDPT